MSRTSRAVHLSSVGDLVRLGLAAEALHELALDVGDPVQLLDHVDGDADRPRLVGDRPRDRLADPPGRVGRELVAAAVVELLDRADQAERTLLDQVEEGEAAAEVTLGDRDDEAQVGLDHVPLRGHVALLDPLRQRDLLGGGEQLDPADRAQVETKRVEARLDREVELRLLRRLALLRLLLLVSGDPVLADDVDAVVDQVGVKAPDLLLGDLDLLERRGDLLESQETLVLALRDQRADLLEIDERRLTLEGAGICRPRPVRGGCFHSKTYFPLLCQVSPPCRFDRGLSSAEYTDGSGAPHGEAASVPFGA